MPHIIVWLFIEAANGSLNRFFLSKNNDGVVFFLDKPWTFGATRTCDAKCVVTVFFGAKIIVNNLIHYD
jgi:hypothetical protein